MDKLEAKLTRLENILRQYDELGIALACCHENLLLSHIAKEVLGARVFALNAEAEIFAVDDEELCQKSLRSLGMELFAIPTREMRELNFMENDYLRCYYCRLYVLGALVKAGRRFGVEHIAVGVTTDVLVDKPETIKVLERLNLVTPFITADISHADAYAIARHKKFPLTKMRHCLVERFPIGMPLDSETLAFLGEAEVFIRQNGLEASVEIIAEGRLKIVLPSEAYPLEDETRQEIKAFMRARKYEIIQWKNLAIPNKSNKI